MHTQVLIVGQGLCGTWLSYFLQQARIPFLVLDDGVPNSSTRVASGMVNPVTGRRMVHTWMADTVIPFAVKSYAEMQASLGFANEPPSLRRCDVLDFFSSPDRRIDFEKKASQLSAFLSWPADEQAFANHVRYELGYGIISPAYQITLPVWLQAWRQHLQANDLLLAQHFDAAALQCTADGINYEGITAHRIVFTNGAAAAASGCFQLLPFAPNKGEALILRIKDLPTQYIFKKGFSISPWKDELFWAGSTYQRTYADAQPSLDFRQQMEAWLQHFLRHPYVVEDQVAAIRPTTVERRPFVGWHPIHTQIGILNGMGTKGVTLAPYFAHQLAENIRVGAPLQADCEVGRYTRVLARK